MAAAKIKIAAFTKNAKFKAIVESIKLYFKACLIPSGVLSNFRVCTNEECKYKLCVHNRCTYDSDGYIQSSFRWNGWNQTVNDFI